jgi:hypothetical protein
MALVNFLGPGLWCLRPLHLGIDTLMQIPLLSGMMIMTYLLFIPDDIAERAVSRATLSARRVLRSRGALRPRPRAP